MKECWNQEPESRPSFKSIKQKLEAQLKIYNTDAKREAIEIQSKLGMSKTEETEFCLKFNNLKLSDAVKETKKRFGSLVSQVQADAFEKTESQAGGSSAIVHQETAQQLDYQNRSGQLETDATKMSGNQATQPMSTYVYPHQEAQGPAQPHQGASSLAGQRQLSGVTTHPTQVQEQQQQQHQQIPQAVYAVPNQQGVPVLMYPPEYGGPQHFYQIQNCQGFQVNLGQGGRPPHIVSQPQQQQITLQDPDKVLTSAVMLALSQELSGDWKNLARCLGFKPPQIDTIEMDNFHYGVQEQAYQMLYKWYQKLGSGAKHSILAESLAAIGRNDLIRHL
uniref:Receptor-interacting serine/threonine-protein kinase 1-like n=1 Tax=Saccoglossus kowalevskii TaxID=10224 RepID=A0ABM0LVH7_SACKO|nr:PREDICTED: receptor-interacting serine/threonine-protein kinase 1-like [Saccoglossus kowalevskii]